MLFKVDDDSDVAGLVGQVFRCRLPLLRGTNPSRIQRFGHLGLFLYYQSSLIYFYTSYTLLTCKKRVHLSARTVLGGQCAFSLFPGMKEFRQHQHAYDRASIYCSSTFCGRNCRS
jgi:hypothetical protein